jgi:hypothetical protein
MLSDEELKKITDMSKYSEEEEKWDMQSFSLKEKSLALPTMKLGGGNNIMNNRFQKRYSNKQVIFQNYGNENELNNNGELNNENINKNFLPKPRDIKKKVSNRRPKDISVNNSGSYTNIKDYDDKLNERINLRISNDKLILDGRRQSKSHVPALRNPVVNQKFFPLNQPNEDERNKVNKILMNQKEREKFEGLGNNRNNKAFLNPLYGSAANPIQLFNKAAGNKHTKIQLNPLGSNQNLNSNINLPQTFAPNKKYKLAQIQEKEY